MPTRAFAIATIVVAALLWSLDPVFRFRTLESVDPIAVALLENLFGLLVITPFFIKQKSKIPRLQKRHIPALLATGLGGSALGTIFYGESLKFMGPSTVNIIQFIQPFFVIFFAYLFLAERRSETFFQLAVWIFLGTLALCLPDFTFGHEASSMGKGVGWGILTMLAWSLSTVGGKALLRDFSPVTVVFFRWATAVISLLVIVAWKSDFSQLTGAGLGSILLIAVLTGILPMWIYYQGLRVLPASVVTLIELLYPILGILIAVAAAGRSLSELQWAGAGAILLGIAFLVALELGFESKKTK